jgi:arginyl-tRNA--protein-N-Asp/Glu arginylyltransferase
MDHDSREQYRHFLLQSNVNSSLVEFREDGRLQMVACRSLGGWPVLRVHLHEPDLPGGCREPTTCWQTDLCRRLRLPYLYLGYWIAQSRKMAYKINSANRRIGIGSWHRLREGTSSSPLANCVALTRGVRPPRCSSAFGLTNGAPERITSRDASIFC